MRRALAGTGQADPAAGDQRRHAHACSGRRLQPRPPGHGRQQLGLPADRPQNPLRAVIHQPGQAQGISPVKLPWPVIGPI